MNSIVKVIKYFFLSVFLIILTSIIFFWKNDIPLDQLKSKYTNSESEFVKIDGMEVHFRKQGLENDSIPIVLLHGTGASLHTWEGWIEALKTNHQVITLDLPAYGLTGANATGDYSMKSYSEFLHRFLISQNIKKCVLGGNSLGGSIAWNYTLDYPNEITKLILVDAGGGALKPKSVPIAFKMAQIPYLKNLFKYVTPRAIVEGSVKNVYGNKELVTDILVDQYFELSLRPGNREAFINRLNGNKVVGNRFQQLKKLKMPILLMWGKKDLLIPMEVEKQFEEILTNETTAIFDDLGHVPMEENSKETVKAVINFLK